MMTFQLDDLTEPELIDLNHRIVERLRYLQQSRAHQAMLDFQIGDRVTFNPEGRGEGFCRKNNLTNKTFAIDPRQGSS